MKWISVEDELPKINKSVLLLIVYDKFDGGTYNETDEICVGGREINGVDEEWFIGNKRMMWDYDYNLQFTFDDITHWMPLPEPPR